MYDFRCVAGIYPLTIYEGPMPKERERALI